MVSINDDDLPADVDVEFEQSSYTVAEGGTVTVKVTLSEDPERTVTIPISKTDQDGATSADYSGVPASVTFNAGDTEKSFTFSATADAVDDDGESCEADLLQPAHRGDRGDHQGDDHLHHRRRRAVGVGGVRVGDLQRGGVGRRDHHRGPRRTRSSVTVTLSADPERTVTIPITKTDQDGASSADYSGVPASVTFNAGDTEKSFTFTATADTVDDDGESVKLTFDTDNLPTGVTEGPPTRAWSPSTTTTLPSSVDVDFGSPEPTPYLRAARWRSR